MHVDNNVGEWTFNRKNILDGGSVRETDSIREELCMLATNSVRKSVILNRRRLISGKKNIEKERGIEMRERKKERARARARERESVCEGYTTPVFCLG